MEPGARELHQLMRRARERSLVDGTLVDTQLRSIALEAVQMVVYPLGDLEELRLAGDDDPAGVDSPSRE